MLTIRSSSRLGLAGAVLLAATAVAGCGLHAGPSGTSAGRAAEVSATTGPDRPTDVLTRLREQRQVRLLPDDAPRTFAEPYDQVPLIETAGPGELDPTFGTRGVTVTRFAEQAYAANGLTVLRDGAIVTAGGDQNYESDEFVLVKYRCDGTADPDFGDEGRVVTPIPRGVGGGAQAIATGPKGKLVAVGTAGLGGPGELGFALVRYRADGELDESFGSGGIVVAPVGMARSAAASDVVVLSNGRILAAGGANDAEGNPGFAAARFLPDGRLDPSFGEGGSVVVPMPGGDAGAFALAVQRDGRIVLAGTAENQGVTSFGLARLTPDGGVDRSFGTGGVVVETFPGAGINGANDVVVDQKGRIVAAGVTGNLFQPTAFGLMRFRADGSLDPTFGIRGRVRTEFEGSAGALGVVVRPDGGLVAAGQAWPNIALAGYEPDGDLDEDFGDDGRTLTAVEAISAATGVALQFNRRIVISGVTGNETLSDAAFLVARYGLLPGDLPNHCERTPSVNGLG
ncbi:hypothetical protein [Micromonospora sp. NPDC049799]|uniref:hypothetical protein n=1 Tax=Micromonospora sp. NPDC049799 TaxID=3154741 RepID=UPI0033E80330